MAVVSSINDINHDGANDLILGDPSESKFFVILDHKSGG
jgi:hypothetical protein